MCHWFSFIAHWCIQERTTDNKRKEKQKCPCKEEHCDVISRFLEPVELSFCKKNTKKLLGGFKTIHYTTQFLVNISNDLQNGKLKRNRSKTRVVSCKGVIQVVVCVHTHTYTHTYTHIHTPLYVGTYRWLNQDEICQPIQWVWMSQLFAREWKAVFTTSFHHGTRTQRCCKRVTCTRDWIICEKADARRWYNLFIQWYSRVGGQTKWFRSQGNCVKKRDVYRWRRRWQFLGEMDKSHV